MSKIFINFIKTTTTFQPSLIFKMSKHIRHTMWTYLIICHFFIVSCALRPLNTCNFNVNIYGERITWKTDSITLYIDTSVPISFYEAIFKAANTWNQALNKTFIKVAILNKASNLSKDNINTIIFRKDWPYQENEQGRTRVYWAGNEIQEVDISINDRDFKYYYPYSFKIEEYSIEALVLHEIGHALGINHIDGTVMDPFLPYLYDRVTLQQKDIESLRCAYDKP